MYIAIQLQKAVSLFNELAIMYYFTYPESCSLEFLAPTTCMTLDNLTCNFFANGRDNFGRVIFEYIRPHFVIIARLCWLYVKQMELKSFYSQRYIKKYIIESLYPPWNLFVHEWKKFNAMFNWRYSMKNGHEKYL